MQFVHTKLWYASYRLCDEILSCMIEIRIENHMVSDCSCNTLKSLKPNIFPQGATNNIRFTTTVGDTTWPVYNQCWARPIESVILIFNVELCGIVVVWGIVAFVNCGCNGSTKKIHDSWSRNPHSILRPNLNELTTNLEHPPPPHTHTHVHFNWRLLGLCTVDVIFGIRSCEIVYCVSTLPMDESRWTPRILSHFVASR